jgi:hypothetical protein
MKFTISKNSFIKDILSPIANLNDRAIISFSELGGVSIVNNTENNVILYLKINIPSKEKIELNIGDVKKLSRALDCVEQDELNFDLSPGMIKYETDEITFKYHLLQSGLIQKHTIDINKINSLEFDTSFNITKDIFSKIIRGTSFATDTNKLYFYTKDKQVYANLTDYTMSQCDLIGFKVSDSFSGVDLKTELPLSIETFKLLQTNKSDTIQVNVNTKLKIIVFNINTELSNLKYIVSGLVK